MTARTITHSLLILSTLFALALVQRTALSAFLPQVLGVLVLVYSGSQVLLWRRWVAAHHEGWIRDSEAVMFVVMGVLLVELTGGLAGPFAFVLYLLVLYLGVLLEPGISLAVAVGLVVYFLPTTTIPVILDCPESLTLDPGFWTPRQLASCQNDIRPFLSDLVRLGSLLLMVPAGMALARRAQRARR